MNNMNEQLNRIAQHHILYGSFNSDLGLFNGKMGIIIFFFHYSRYLKNSLYEHFAFDLLNDIIADIHNEMSICLSKGLCGIGWGINYLICNKFIEGDPNEILVDIDNKIMEFDPHRVSNYSLEFGLEGIACYIFSRVNGISFSKCCQSLDSDYIRSLRDACFNKLEGRREIILNTPEEICRRVFKQLFNNSLTFENGYSWQKGLKNVLTYEAGIFNN